jgi:quercetin dioxygenase-like cupin family protein
MQSHRLYSDEDGETHFEVVSTTFTPMEYAPPAPAFGLSEPTEATRYVTVRFPAGWNSGLHPTPRRQVFVVLSGRLEGEASDGMHMSFGAGDVLLMEDTEGKGHTARVVGRDDVLAMMIHLE